MHNNYSTNKKLELIINNFIKKVINDNKNYNLIKNITNNNHSIKLINIFLDNNNIDKITTEKLKINCKIEDSINNLLNSKSLFQKYFLKKIFYFNFNINKDNLDQLLIINNDNNKNNNNLYNINFINFDIINKNIILDKKYNIDNIILNNNSLFFIQDLNCIYLIFEKNIINKIYIKNGIKIINNKTKNIDTKIINNKTKKNNK